MNTPIRKPAATTRSVRLRNERKRADCAELLCKRRASGFCGQGSCFTAAAAAPLTGMIAVARTLGAPVALALGAGAGAVLVTQNGINVNLRVLVLKDPFLTALASFAVGWVAVILAAVVHRPRCNDGASLRKAPWYAYTGGVLGPVYVVAANVASPRLGFASYQLLATLGQLVASLIADARGFLILPKRRPTPWRIAALCVLAGGAVLSIDPEFSDLTWYEGLGFGSLAFAAGTIFPVQACVNAVMAQHLKTALRGAVVSFTGGVLILGILAGISVGARGGLVPDGSASEWWLWFGGLCGAYIVSANCAAVPIVGRLVLDRLHRGAAGRGAPFRRDRRLQLHAARAHAASRRRRGSVHRRRRGLHARRSAAKVALLLATRAADAAGRARRRAQGRWRCVGPIL